LTGFTKWANLKADKYSLWEEVFIMGCFMPSIKNPIKLIEKNKKRLKKQNRKGKAETGKKALKAFLDLID
jgi:hypothetical protein